MATIEDLKMQVEDFDKRISVLEWDKARDQINPSKLAQLDELRKERTEAQAALQAAEKAALAPKKAPQKEDAKTVEVEDVVTEEDEVTEELEESERKLSEIEEDVSKLE